MNFDSTIAALATPRGTGGVAIIRISGPQSWTIGQALLGKPVVWIAGQVAYGWLVDPQDGQPVDEVLCFPFQGPHSFTGEDVLEIHCHGGLIVSQTVLQLCFQAGAAPAEAGEFSRRALMNGRIDLAQAESILDLIHAQGTALVKLSAGNLQHRTISRRLQDLLSAIGRIQADLVASIDFPDEVDEPDRALLTQDVQSLHAGLVADLDRNRRAQHVRDGVTVAILGRPNAGKSSLFNALLSADRAIVTDIAGTTRDLLRETLSLGGIPVTLVDTAGLRDTVDVVESLGVERSRQAAEAAQAVLYLCDAATGLTLEDKAEFAAWGERPGLLVWSKADLIAGAALPEVLLPPQWVTLTASTVTGAGQSAILDWLVEMAAGAGDIANLDALLSHRQLDALTQVADNLDETSRSLAHPGIPLDLATVPLTDALMAIQGLLGQDTTEAVLDSVFARFCVGK